MRFTSILSVAIVGTLLVACSSGPTVQTSEAPGKASMETAATRSQAVLDVPGMT